MFFLARASRARQTPIWQSARRSPTIRRAALHQQAITAAARLTLILLSLLSLRWAAQPPIALLALAWIIITVAHVLWATRTISDWTALVADGAAASLILCATSAEATPLLGWAPIILIVLGATLRGGPGAAIAGAIAAAALLLAGWAGHSAAPVMIWDSAIVAALAGLGVATALATHQAAIERLTLLAEQAGEEARALRRTAAWQREVADLTSAQSIIELEQRGAAHAMKIAGAGTRVDLSAPAQPFIVAPHRADSGPAGLDDAILSSAQTDALQMLSAVIGARAGQLEGLAWRERTRSALDALWQVAIASRYTTADPRTLLAGPCQRLAGALQIDWVALLTAEGGAPLTPTMLVHTTDRPPLIQPAQMRVAAEALRGGRPLIRSEGRVALVCLPVVRVGRNPLVIVAYGDVADETAQTILLLLGDLLARRFDAA